MHGVGGIDAVFLHAERPGELARWYADHLGAGPEPQAGPALRTLPAEPGSSGEGWSVSFAVRDLDSMLDQLRADGIEVSLPQQDSDGRYATLHDPEGNPLRLCQRAFPDDEAGRPPRVLAVDDEPSSASKAEARSPTRRRIATWTPFALVVILAAVFVVVIDPGGNTGNQAASTTSPTAIRSPQPPSDRVAEVATTVRGIELGHPILGIQGDWELVAQGLDEVVRIEPAAGRVTRIGLPSVDDTGSLSMVVWPDRTLLHSATSAETYVVHDDGMADRLRARPHRGTIYPGPEAGQVWLPGNQESSADYTLVSTDRDRPALHPGWDSEVLGSDLRGNLLVRLAGDVYRGKGTEVRRITTGELIAVGPTKFLVLECGEKGECSSVVIDRDTGERRVLHTGVGRSAGLVGRISPDGSTAAVLTREQSRTSLRLIDLESGLVRALPDIAEPGGFGTDLVWSPDGKWLFIAAGDGALRAVNVEMAPDTVLAIRTALPPVSDLAVRPAPSP